MDEKEEVERWTRFIITMNVARWTKGVAQIAATFDNIAKVFRQSVGDIGNQSQLLQEKLKRRQGNDYQR